MTKLEEKQIRQRKISIWLKALIIVGAIFVLAISIAVDRYLDITGQPAPMKLFLYYTDVSVYMIFWEFWHVCTQIGKDNSFSLENSKHFHRMSACGIAMMLGFILRPVMGYFTGTEPEYAYAIDAGEIVIAFAIAVLCECMAKLIHGAYEIKEENDLTI